MEKSWTLTKTAFVRADDFDSGCKCRFSIAYDPAHDEASLSIGHSTKLADVEDNPRTLTLLIRPPTVDSCTLALETDGNLLPPFLLRLIPTTSVTDAAEVLTLTLALKSTGTVLYPKGLTNVRPVSQDDSDFQAFIAICRTTTIHIHLAKAQLGFNNPNRKDEELQLQHFVASLSLGLQTKHISLNRLDGGRGVQEGTWRVLDAWITSPPEYCEPGSAAHVLGKRARSVSAASGNASVKRSIIYTTPPPYSPTEINTPTPMTRSTDSTDLHRISPSYIRPTVFTHCPPPYLGSPRFKTEPKLDLDPQVSILAQMLKVVPGDLLRKAMMESGHEQLLCPPVLDHVALKASQPVATAPTDKVAVYKEKDETRLQDLIDARFKKFTETCLGPLIREMFSSQVDTRLQALVNAGLPLHTEEAFEKVMREHQDQIYADFQEAEVKIQEMVDDASLEIKMALEDGLRDVEGRIEEHLQRVAEESDDLAERAATTELKLERLRHRLYKSAKTHRQSHDGDWPIRKTDSTLLRCKSV